MDSTPVSGLTVFSSVSRLSEQRGKRDGEQDARRVEDIRYRPRWLRPADVHEATGDRNPNERGSLTQWVDIGLSWKSKRPGRRHTSVQLVEEVRNHRQRLRTLRELRVVEPQKAIISLR